MSGYSRAGGTLKHSTGQMKIRHMAMVMEFKQRLKEPTSRDELLIAIEKLMGRTESYHRWFDRIYRLYRNTDLRKYERAIRNKYYYEKRRNDHV
jgi:hypothetical protein